MKLKNVTFFDKHAEKLAIGLTMIVLLGAVYFYGLSTPNQVTIKGKTLAPAEVDPLIVAEARRLKQRLDSDQIPEILNRPTPSYTADFVSRLDSTVLPPVPFDVAFNPIPAIRGIDEGPAQPYHVPSVPAPLDVVARADLGTIAPEEIAGIPGLAQRFAADAPADGVWTSISARFDLGAMLAQLEHQPTGEVRALPEDWWAGTFAIVDVQVERQEQRPDGSWPKEGDADFAKLTTLVNPFPGQLSLRELVLDAVTQDQGAEFVRRLQQFQQQIIQPPFYTLRGQPWTPPQPLKVSDQPAGGTDSGRPAELQARIEKNEQLIEALNGRIAAARAPRNPARSTTRPTAPGGELLPTDTASTRSPAGNTATDRLVESLQKQIAAKQAENLKLQDEYAQLTGKKAQIARTTIVAPTDEIRGEGDIGGSAPRSPFAPAARPGVPSDRVTTEQFRQGFQGGPAQDDQPAAKPIRLNLGPLVLNPQTSNMVNLWAIDLDTKPGHSYRYRVQVGVVNPLFNKPNLPKEQVQVHKAKFVLLSKPSEWSQPITLETLGHYFVINGSRAPAPGNVTFNVWRFYDGQWRSAEFRARPGDPIGGPGTGESSGINFDTRATLVDIDFDFPVPAKVGSLPQKTIRALVMQEDNILPRRRDIDSTDPKLDWLKTQRTQTTASQ